MRVSGTRYQIPIALVIGKDEDLLFGRVASIYVDGQDVLFEFLPMVTHEFCYHHHAFALGLSAHSTKYLIRHCDLLDYHPYGLYHSSTVSSEVGIQFVVLRSSVYV